MTARQLSGRPLAADINAASEQRVARLAERGVAPALGLAVTESDSSSESYLRMIRRSAARVGIETVDIDLGTDPTGARDRLEHAVAGPRISGVIVQTPLPPGMDLAELASVLPPLKDVDGASTQSLGRLMAGLSAHPPATAEAVVALLEHYDVELSGRHVVVVGRSLVVGKPLAQLLLARDATVTVCHSRTKDRGSSRPITSAPRRSSSTWGRTSTPTAMSSAMSTRQWRSMLPHSRRSPAGSAP
jgi:methylenetetrahydrofolate dehydrogenase (NADP+)/methenyltetrahydrofolate cyclohydrolase